MFVLAVGRFCKDPGPRVRARGAVTATHFKTKDKSMVSRRADRLLVAIDRREFVRGDQAGRDGEGDVMHRIACGEACRMAGAITPVPGQPRMTIGCLFANTVSAHLVA